MECLAGADNKFGPAVKCSNQFDFTLLFEQSFFQIAPSAVLLLILPLRTSQLLRQHVKTKRTGIHAVKQTAIAVLAVTQLALLVAWSILPQASKASIPGAVLSLLASVALLFLSNLEHSRSVRPSSLINLYMLFQLILDLPQARTLWMRSGSLAVPSIFSIGLAVKAVVLYVEARSKRRSLLAPYLAHAPESLVNLYDRTVLFWLNSLFLLGYKSIISFEKLYEIEADLSSEILEQDFWVIWSKRSITSKRPLLWAMASTSKTTLLSMVVPRLCLSGLKLSQPLLINRVTTWIGGNTAQQSMNVGHGLTGAAVCIYIGLAITKALYQRQLDRFTTKVKGILTSAIHAKALHLSAEQLADNATLTLISADVNRICNSMRQLDDLFATPVEIAVAITILAGQIGVSCIAPVALAVTISAVSFYNSNKAVPLQKDWLLAVQGRISYTAAVLGCPKGFKMLGLTDYLSDRIQELRVRELTAYAGFRKFAAYRNTFSAVPPVCSGPLTLTMFTLINGGQALTITVAFTTLSIVSLLAAPIQNIIHAVPMFQTALASLDRIQALLLMSGDDQALRTESSSLETTNGNAVSVELLPLPPKTTAPMQTPPILNLASATVRFGKERWLILRDINLSLNIGSLTMVIGPVGCGKSTLLQALIGETILAGGHRLVSDSSDDFAYCAQDAWLPNGTVKSLIVGYSMSDESWYEMVVQACALGSDMAFFPQGDETTIGTRGISLSGGQRQRLALARALYARKRIFVADDPFSGLDPSTSRQIFDRVFGPVGIVKKLGVTAVLATHSVQYLAQADQIIALNPDGSMLKQGTFSELESTKGYVHQLRTKEEEAVELESAAAHVVLAKPLERNGVESAQQDLARRTGDMAVYSYYAKSIGWKYGSVILLTTITYVFGITFTSEWVRLWSESAERRSPRISLGLGIGIALLLAASAVVSVFVKIWVMLVDTVPQSSAQLHRQLLHTVMRAPYTFFVNTDSGVTLNRFSNDMSTIEMELAGAVMQTLSGVALCTSGAVLVAASSEYTGIAMPFVVLVLYGIQRFYLRTSRQLRFMELEAQAPLLTHVSETLAGVTTIRAFRWQHQSHQKCLDLLDRSQRPYYLMLCIQRWLNLVLDLTTAGIATIVVAIATTSRGASTAGSVGVSLLNILSFNTNLAYLIVAWTTLETSLGAVARCKNFEASTSSEDMPAEHTEPPADWPQSGALDLRDVTASYNDEGGIALKSISVGVAAGEKVGICGRSGSGKSSLLLTILRLLDNSAGIITLDGVDLTTIPRQTIRSRLTALPQEVITVPGSLRDNLDPLGNSPEEAASFALERVGLSEAVKQRGGLDAPMSDLPLSQGQMQLFAVARATLRRSKVLLVDEMTSSVDAVTEELMMSIITEVFKESTVIAVAHRLKTVIDFDKIIVIDKGNVVEVGRPQDLLRKENGWFKAMWHRGGY